MKLNELVSNSNNLIGLLKFSEKKYLESLVKCELYMNQFKYFKELEEKEGQREQGDEKKEVALTLNDVTWKLTSQKDNDVIVKGSASEVILRSLEDLQNHLFCTTAITPDILEVVSYDEENGIAQTKLALPEELVTQAQGILGNHFALINAGKFLERIEEVTRETKITVIRDIVQYNDQSINHFGKVSHFKEDSLKRYFEKDVYFKYQNEYRLVAFGGDSSGPIKLELGDMKEFIAIFETKELLENDLNFTINLGSENN